MASKYLDPEAEQGANLRKGQNAACRSTKVATMQGEDLEEVPAAKAMPMELVESPKDCPKDLAVMWAVETMAAKPMAMGFVESPTDCPKDFAVMRVVETTVAKPMGSPICSCVQPSNPRMGAASARAGMPRLDPYPWN